MISIVPRPRFLHESIGRHALDAASEIASDSALEGVADLLQEQLRRATGFPLTRTRGDASIRLLLDPNLGPEAYRLRVDSREISITAGAAAGAFYGIQVLMQLLPDQVFRAAPLPRPGGWSIPNVDIADEPRFEWRGVMLDVARHFMPKHDVLRFIDLMALHRLNTLHWHLSDDQGWRVEITKYPLLTAVGGWRHESQVGPPPHSSLDGRPHGGFYTQDDVREVVAYAHARHIVIVPEIDVPGHSSAAIAAYPQLGIGVDETGAGGPHLEVSPRWGVIQDVLNTEDSTVQFFIDVFDELLDLFPAPFIGIGGDECPKDGWRNDERTQVLMRHRGLRDEEELQSWFMSRLAEHLISRGRRPFGWDELLESEPPAETTIASWRGMTGARSAVRRGYSVVACPDDKVYLDYRQSESPEEPIPFSMPLTLEDAYSFRPIPDGITDEEAALILGGQANVWTEHMDSPRVVDYFVFPRLCAIAEVLWGTEEDDFAAFEIRLRTHLRRLDAIGVEYRRHSGPTPWQRRPGIAGRPSTRSDHAELISRLVANIVS